MDEINPSLGGGFGSKKKLSIALVLVLFLGSALLWKGLLGEPRVTQREVSQPSLVAEASSAATLSQIREDVLVTRVIDGDTIEIEGGRKVRYVGIDTPETVDPRRAVGCFGQEASRENKGLVEGKEVYLMRDISEEDKYGRLLRLVYLPLEDGSAIFVNDYLVRQGFAKAMTVPPDVTFAKQFVEAQREARVAKRGLWEKCG